mgnify:CR=1 FL=1
MAKLSLYVVAILVIVGVAAALLYHSMIKKDLQQVFSTDSKQKKAVKKLAKGKDKPDGTSPHKGAAGAPASSSAPGAHDSDWMAGTASSQHFPSLKTVQDAAARAHGPRTLSDLKIAALNSYHTGTGSALEAKLAGLVRSDASPDQIVNALASDPAVMAALQDTEASAPASKSNITDRPMSTDELRKLHAKLSGLADADVGHDASSPANLMGRLRKAIGEQHADILDSNAALVKKAHESAVETPQDKMRRKVLSELSSVVSDPDLRAQIYMKVGGPSTAVGVDQPVDTALHQIGSLGARHVQDVRGHSTSGRHPNGDQDAIFRTAFGPKCNMDVEKERIKADSKKLSACGNHTYHQYESARGRLDWKD